MKKMKKVLTYTERYINIKVSSKEGEKLHKMSRAAPAVIAITFVKEVMLMTGRRNS